jgi:mono/diheme cytochrome c family protein
MFMALPVGKSRHEGRALVLVLLLAVISVAVSSGCNPSERTRRYGLAQSTDSPGISSNPNANWSYINSNVLPRCTTCHNGGTPGANNFKTYAGVMTAVTPYQPLNSDFFVYVAPNSPNPMPMGQPSLSQTQIDAIRDWISVGAPGPAPAPSPTATSPASPQFSVAMPVITTNCVSCHTAGGAAPLDFTPMFSSEAEWIKSGLVVAGSPQNSRLYRALQGSG